MERELNNWNMQRTNGNINDVYNYVNFSLTFVEAKNGALVVLNSGIIIAVFSLWEKVPASYHTWCLFAFLPAVVSLAFSLVSYYPWSQKRIKDQEVDMDEEKINLFRCEGIAKMPISQLRRCFVVDDESSFVDKQKLNYIARTSMVVARKYRFFRRALWSFSAYGVYLLTLLLYMIFK